MWIDWIFHSHISVYIYRHKNVCVRKTGRKRHPILYLSSYRFLIGYIVFSKEILFLLFCLRFFMYYVSMRRVARYIRQLCPEYLSSILRADYICEFDLFKTAGKISIFLRHHVYGSSQKKRHWRVCVGVKSSIFLTLNVNRTMLWCVISYFVNIRPVLYNITKCQIFIY